MRRRQLFEIEDQPWLPSWVRDAMTEHLSGVFVATAVAPLHVAVAERLAAVLERAGTDHLVDLCSGSGGPLPAVLPLLEQRIGHPVTATLTDRYPNHGLGGPTGTDRAGLAFEPRPVDARAVPPDLVGVRTMFNAIHHFPPEQVAEVLRSATAGGRSFAVFEPFERRPRLALRLAAGALRGGWRDAGRAPGPRLQRAALHLLLPLALSWDGAVSVLRAYDAEELLAIARTSGAAAEVAWRAERVALPWGAVTVLIGEPAA